MPPYNFKQRMNEAFMTPSQLSMVNSREEAARKAEEMKAARARQEADMMDTNIGGQNFRLPQGDVAKFAMERELARAKKSAGGAINKDSLTPAQLAADRAYGKEYTDWDGGGLTSVQKSIRDLEAVKNRIAPIDPKTGKPAIKDPSLSGGLKSMLPQFVKPYLATESEAVKQQIAGAMLPSLKMIFPGAASDDERKAIIEQAWNDKLPVADNITNIESILKQMKDKQAQGESQAAYYEDTGTTAGWKYQNPQGQGGVPDRKTELNQKLMMLRNRNASPQR